MTPDKVQGRKGDQRLRTAAGPKTSTEQPGQTGDHFRGTDDLVAELRRRPSELALRQAGHLDHEVEGRDAALRRAFVNADYSSSPPPAAVLLRHGGGLDAVRLKLFLAIVWVAPRVERYRLGYSPRAWAGLLDLADVDDTGRRRVREAIAFLDKTGLVSVKPRAGRGPEITLRREDGSTKRYTPAWKEGNYFALPRAFFTQGWLSVLSGPAISVLLVLLEAASGRAASRRRRAAEEEPGENASPKKSKGKKAGPVWISASERKRRYDLSEDTWQAGINELKAHELISTMTLLYYGDEGFDDFGKRVTITVHLDRLTTAPAMALWKPARPRQRIRRPAPVTGIPDS